MNSPCNDFHSGAGLHEDRELIDHVARMSRHDGRAEDLVRAFLDMDPGKPCILPIEDAGFARVHIQKGTDKILGATIVAAHAGDMINEFSVAMKAGAGANTIAGTIHPYPTQAEVNKKVVNLWRKAHFSPRKKALLMKLFAWMRRG